MPALTVAEKTHWKDRLPKRIDRRIETLAAGPLRRKKGAKPTGAPPALSTDD